MWSHILPNTFFQGLIKIYQFSDIFQFNRIIFQQEKQPMQTCFPFIQMLLSFLPDFGVGPSARANRCMAAHLIFNCRRLKNKRNHGFPLSFCLAFSPNPHVFPTPPATQVCIHVCVCACGCVLRARARAHVCMWAGLPATKHCSSPPRNLLLIILSTAAQRHRNSAVRLTISD